MQLVPVLSKLLRTLPALALLGCAESVQGPTSTPTPRSANEKLAASGQDPLVLIASSHSPCEGGNRIDIAANVVADEKALVAVFGEDARFTLATKLAPLRPESKIRERGLVLIYSGHGVAVREGERETTHLCLPNDERLSTDTLFEWIRDQGPLWATVILNGCETAQVNPAVVSSPPISVISASPSVVTPSSLPEVDGTDFIRELIGLIAPAQHSSVA